MKNSSILILALLLLAAGVWGCRSDRATKFTGAAGEVHLVVLDPGHFHAALVQKVSYGQVNANVHVYAPEGEDVGLYLDKISSYNARKDDPTRWNEIVYKGPDFLQRMLSEHRGNVVVLAGRNGVKIDYILASVSAGMNVLSDKPMVIDGVGFQKLLGAFDKARKKGLLLYDIMTERYEATNALQRELARMPGLIGPIDKGTPDDPAIVQQSIHYFAKVVSGTSLIRPEWYFDTAQQGEGIVDATTHLIDLVQLTVVGEEPIDYKHDVQIVSASRWQTPLSRAQYRFVTGKNSFPDFLAPYIKNDTLNVFANGRIDYALRGVNVRVIARWDYMAPAGGDNEYAVVRGGKGSVVILQGAAQNYKPMLYVEAAAGQDTTAFANTLRACVARLAAGAWPGLSVVALGPGASATEGAALAGRPGADKVAAASDGRQGANVGPKARSARRGSNVPPVARSGRPGMAGVPAAPDLRPGSDTAPAPSGAPAAGRWQVVIPDSYDVGHEAHFGQVAENFLHFLTDGKLPEWEVAGMKAKYYITTTALDMALKAPSQTATR